MQRIEKQGHNSPFLILGTTFLLVLLILFSRQLPVLAGESLVIPQGGVGVYEIEAGPEDSAPWGSIRGELVQFRKLSERRFQALVGVDMEWTVGEYPLEIRVINSGESRVIERKTVRVVDGKFAVQHLTLPGHMVDLDEETLARVTQEKERIYALWDTGEKKAQWDEGWLMPVEGKLSGSFGKRRVINGNPSNPHNGEDISAPKGRPVISPNSGIVRLAEDQFYGGNTLVIDHGAGLFTFYMHLDSLSVKEGQQVARGELLGHVGSTGRSTGPHLHWGGRLNNARINPVSLTRL